MGGWIRPTLRSCGLAVASWNDDIAVSYLQWQADDVEVESGCQRNGVVKGQARGDQHHLSSHRVTRGRTVHGP